MAADMMKAALLGFEAAIFAGLLLYSYLVWKTSNNLDMRELLVVGAAVVLKAGAEFSYYILQTRNDFASYMVLYSWFSNYEHVYFFGSVMSLVVALGVLYFTFKAEELLESGGR